MDESLRDAIRHGDISRVLDLLASGMAADRADIHGLTPLMLATRCRSAAQIEIIDALLARGCSLDAVEQAGRMPLTLAVQASNPLVVRRLIEAGSALHGRHDALAISFHNANVEIAKHLAQVELRAPTNRRPCCELIISGTPSELVETTPSMLFAAVLVDRPELLPMLAAGHDLEARLDGETPIQYAARLDRSACVAALLATGASTSSRTSSMYADDTLSAAARVGSFAIVRHLLAHGVTPQSGALAAAAAHGVEMTQLVLDHVIDNREHELWEALWSATHRKDAALTRMLLQAGAAPNIVRVGEELASIDTVFKGALGVGNIEVVRTFLEFGADVHLATDTISIKGETALVFLATVSAQTDNFVALAKLLLGAGADPRFESDAGTPIEIARQIRQDELVCVLEGND